MKDKIIMLVIGIVIGVIIAGACFWFATSVTGNKNLGEGQMPEMEDRGDRGGMKPDQEIENENTTTNNSSTNTNT